ncbi:MAG: ATP-binding protein [Eubacterium sp.]|nr:ATP-binding protein [Eubacterium sp.]
MISKLFFSLLPVQILIVAISSINGIADGLMASNFIGPDAMAVIGLYSPVIKIFETVNVVLLGGSQILCGQFLGKNQIEKTQGIFTLDISLIVSFAAVLAAICLVYPDQVAHMLSNDADIRSGLTDYIRGMAPGILPQMLGTQLTVFLQIEQQSKRTYAGIMVMVATNLALDYLFIRILGMSMLGLGLATTISYMAFFVVLGIFYLSRKAIIKFNLHNVDVNETIPIIAIGIPGALTTFCLAIRGVILNAVLFSCSGNDGVSALSALNTCGYLLYAVTAGLAAATRLLVSVYIGEEDRTSLVTVMRTALLKGVAIVCAVSAAVMMFAGPITYLFYKDTASQVYYLTLWLFRIYPLCMPLSAICAIFVNYYQSSSRMGIVNLLSAFDGLLGICIATVILAPLYGSIGVWIAHVVNGIITTLIVILYAWKVNGKAPSSVEDLLTIPDSFGVPEDKRIDISIHNADEVANTSELIMEFCKRNGVDRKRSYYAGLCMEEMAANIVEHGFDDEKKSHSADVRVVYKDDSLILRIKDDCKPFDPKEKLALIDPDDITKNIGLRMVQRLAKTMSYTSMLGMNVLTMTI